ncbi:MAG: hypothetical protein GY847_19260 [Proteobacteria bacterium]|nr:hypothetical protein [Pseudomonadota bacterium]
MKESQTRMTVGMNDGLFKRLKEIADRRRCNVDELVEESVKARYRLYDIEERLAAVDEMAGMDLPVGEWDEMEREILDGTVDR